MSVKSPPIQVFLGAVTPTTIAASVPDQPSLLGFSLPQPTYTLLPTYTPYPTFTPARTVLAPKPITVIPTLSTDQQNPPPGSIIPAGEGYTLNGVTVTILKPFCFGSDNFGIQALIENNSSAQILVRWKDSYIHARDDKGKLFRQIDQNASDWDQLKQFAISGGDKHTIRNYCTANMNYDYWVVDIFDRFQGKIDSSAKYLVVAIDQMAGMTNMSWRYDLQ